MTSRNKCNLLRHTALSGAAAALIALMPGVAHADADADAKIARLLDLLVKKNIVSPKQAKELFRETEGVPAVRRAAPVDVAPPAKPGDIRVTYVPQFVRKQIADDVRAQMMSQAQAEGWAAPNALPEWTQRIKLYGDLRVRYDRDSFDKGNYNKFVNFQNINQGSAFNLEGSSLPPFLNTTEGRDRERVRARIGVMSQIDDWLTTDFRITTGADQGPVTPNQTQGSPGDFAKYNVYIDRASFKATPINGLTVQAGRFANPFDTTDLIFYNELGFDGLAASYSHTITPTTAGFITGGVFPILNTAFDFSTNSITKYPSTNAYLFAVQAGAKWQVKPDILAKFAAGFFDFNDVQGAVSAPCAAAPDGSYTCNTDATRFPYAQFGNTVYAIRDIIPTNIPGQAVTDPQYFGLASRFAVIEAHPRVEITTYAPIDIAIDAEYLKNIGYNRQAILDHGPTLVGLIGPQNPTTNGQYSGGDTAYFIRAQLGALQIRKRWDWNVMVGYKYLESDSTLDSINDADFHLGGTNAKGYVLTGSLGIAKDTYVSLRYFDATTISGPQDNNQVLQLDLLSSF
jgi:hypothetical protein